VRRIARVAAIPALLLGIGVVSATTTNTANAAAGGTTLTAGQILTGGQYIVNGNGEMVMGTDGNLVVDACGYGIWATGTVNHPGAYAKMQSDGNFVVYSSSGSALWNSGTANHPGAYVTIQPDTNAVVYSSTGSALWSSRTSGATDCSDRIFYTASGSSTGIIDGAHPLYSADRNHVLMISQSALRIWNQSKNNFIWSWCYPYAWEAGASMGNMLVLSSPSSVACQSGSHTTGGAYLQMQNDGNAVLYTDWRTVLWSSGTAGQ
jgi:hypothetical protein